MVFLHILHVCIINMSVTDVSNHGSELTNLFIKLLHYRSDQNVSFCTFAVESLNNLNFKVFAMMPYYHIYSICAAGGTIIILPRNKDKTLAALWYYSRMRYNLFF